MKYRVSFGDNIKSPFYLTLVVEAKNYKDVIVRLKEILKPMNPVDPYAPYEAPLKLLGLTSCRFNLNLDSITPDMVSCDENTGPVIPTTLWTFAMEERAAGISVSWRAWDCFGRTQEELYQRMEKKFGRDRKAADALGLMPVQVKTIEFPNEAKYHQMFADITRLGWGWDE